MKKLIGALALTTIAFGFAFADANVGINYRTQGSIYTGVTAYNAKEDKEEMYNFLLGQQKNPGIGAEPTDTVKFSIAGEACGVTFSVVPSSAATALNNLGEYSGWIKIAGVEFGMGCWKDGKYDGGFQVKNDADASNAEGGFFAAYKLGNLGKSAKAYTYQIDNVVAIAGGSNQLAGYVQWKGNLGKVKTTLIGALIATGAYEDPANTGLQSQSGFGLRGTFAFQKTTLQLVLKSAKEFELASGLHIMYKPAKTTTWIIGTATAITLKDYNKDKGDGSMNYVPPVFGEEWNIDLRMRYADGPFSFTMMHNFSHNEAGATFGKMLGGFAGGAGTGTGLSAGVGTNKKMESKFENGLWNLFAIRYKVNDTVTVLAQVGQQCPLDKSNWKKYGMNLFVNPGLQFFANSGASIMLGVSWGCVGLGSDNDDGAFGAKDHRIAHEINVPCIVRVKL